MMGEEKYTIVDSRLLLENWKSMVDKSELKTASAEFIEELLIAHKHILLNDFKNWLFAMMDESYDGSATKKGSKEEIIVDKILLWERLKQFVKSQQGDYV
jgi:hypothetical protein